MRLATHKSQATQSLGSGARSSAKADVATNNSTAQTGTIHRARRYNEFIGFSSPTIPLYQNYTHELCCWIVQNRTISRPGRRCGSQSTAARPPNHWDQASGRLQMRTSLRTTAQHKPEQSIWLGDTTRSSTSPHRRSLGMRQSNEHTRERYSFFIPFLARSTRWMGQPTRPRASRNWFSR